MIKTTVQVEGMACSMCEAHINDAVRKALSVKKVTSSHKKGETVVLSESEIDVEKLKAAINQTGYQAGEAKQELYVKKGLFSHFES